MPRRLLQSVVALVVAGSLFGSAAPAAVGVVGGTPIQIQSAPWTVLIDYAGASQHFLCAGSIIDPSHVVTAAHCLYGGDPGAPLGQPSALSIRAGISNFASPSSTDAEQDRSVSSFRVHPGFVNQELETPDDVAVLTLAQPLDLSGSAVKALSLPAPNAPYPAGAAATFAGYGIETPSSAPSGPLESMSETVQAQGVCGKFTQIPLISSTNAVDFCASSALSSSCGGDSGGGLVTTGRSPVLIGVNGAGEKGCPVGSEGFFVDVAAPEILRFVEGDDAPPTAPRPSSSTTPHLIWNDPIHVGDALTCSTGGWREPVRISYSFLNTVDGHLLQAGPRSRYVVSGAALGARIACEVLVTNQGGTTTLTSPLSTSQVVGPSNVEIEPLAPLSGRPGREVTLHAVLKSSPRRAGKFSLCAVLPTRVGGHLCRSTQQPFGPTGYLSFTLVLPIKPTAPSGTAQITITATVGLSTVTTTLALRVASQ